MNGEKSPRTVNTLPFSGQLSDVDPTIDELIRLEEERQQRRIILIPSESICHPVVRNALDSVYTNLYAEGYPSSLAAKLGEKELSDFETQIASYRRYADRRFYKGTDYINLVESICLKRAAETFANERVGADSIFVNAQALSGAAANLAVLEAFLRPGDTMMSMDLMHGGHLSHGSMFHMSGKRYEVASYGIDAKTGRLDYEQIERIAMQSKPRIIIAGYTSYPWAPDWERFRAIADACGAILLADIAHPAGLVAAGAYPSPIGYADVVTFTTHKTLMGPRGALILTTSEEKAHMIDMAVFPGEQGGPHINAILAIAVALKLAQTEGYKEVQRATVRNAAHFAKALQDQGMKLAYGGTDTHLMLLDLKSLPKVTDEVLRGEMAVRILELAGIVANKNTIPGDDLTAMATGVRVGTPWVTQRGMNEDQLSKLAELMVHLLKGIHPFHYDGLQGTLPRGKVAFGLLEEVKREVAKLADELAGEPPRRSGYPHYHFPKIVESALEDTTDEPGESTAMFASDGGLIRVGGERAEAFIQNLVTNDISLLETGAAIRTLMLDGEGALIDDVVVRRDAAPPRKVGFTVIANPKRAAYVLAWMRGHADGYLLFDESDITAKIEGPAIVEDMTDKGSCLLWLCGKGASALAKETGLAVENILHVDNEDIFYLTVPDSSKAELVESLSEAGAVAASFEAFEKLRKAQGLPVPGMTLKELVDAGDSGWFAMHKPYFVAQKLVSPLLPEPSILPEFEWKASGEPKLKRTELYGEHAKLTKKLVPFAGWEMPVWYTSTMEEHRAVREAAALFDVSHMGVFDVKGENATAFLDLVTTNYAKWSRDGESFYSYLLDIEGNVIDDIMVYRMSSVHYIIIVNAGNEEEDWAWLNAVNDNKVSIDREIPGRRVGKPTMLRNLKDPSYGEDRLVDIAFQGPKSRDVLLKLMAKEQHAKLKALKRTAVGEFTVNGQPAVIARTGYTGESMGFEILVHPDTVVELWNAILEKGKPLGVIPAGLGARDSLRTEAGLPLYGHELAGPYGISPMGAGFPSYVKFHKPFFIGKKALLKQQTVQDKVVIRFQVPEKGRKPIRPGDPVVGPRGAFIGNVTSSAIDGEGGQVGLAYINVKAAKPSMIAIYPQPPEKSKKGIASPAQLEKGSKTILPVSAEIVERFPKRSDPIDQVRTEAQIAIESLD